MEMHTYQNRFSAQLGRAGVAIASLVLLIALFAFTSGCANRTSSQTGGAGIDEDLARSEFEDAALAPFTDLNIRRTPIPEKLLTLDTPYAPIAFNCDVISTEVIELSLILGPDSDQQSDENEEDLAKTASREAADYAFDTVEGATTSFIPFRSLVRRASGATAHEKALRDAYEKGIQRRAYLKGIGQALSCIPPAAPMPEASPDELIKYRYVDPDD